MTNDGGSGDCGDCGDGVPKRFNNNNNNNNNTSLFQQLTINNDIANTVNPATPPNPEALEKTSVSKKNLISSELPTFLYWDPLDRA